MVLRRVFATLAAVAALAVAGCTAEDTEALRDLQESVGQLGEELSSSAAQARERLEEVSPDLRNPLEGSLSEAEQAAQQAEDALAGTGEELDEATRQRLEEAKGSIEEAQQQVEEATSGLPESVQEAFASVERELEELRTRIDDALSA